MNLEYLVKIEELKERYESLARHFQSISRDTINAHIKESLKEFQSYLSGISTDFRFKTLHKNDDENFGEIIGAKATRGNLIVTLKTLNPPKDNSYSTHIDKVVFSLSIEHTLIQEKEYKIILKFTTSNPSIASDTHTTTSDEMNNAVEYLNNIQDAIENLNAVARDIPNMKPKYHARDKESPSIKAEGDTMEALLFNLLSQV